MKIIKICFQKLYKLPFKFYWFVCKFIHTKSAYSIYGVKLTSNFTDQTFRFCLKGTYGYQFSSFLDNRSIPFIFLDIGANQGLYSLISARNQQCRHVWAFEPVKNTYSILRKNITLNKRDSKITGIQCAISESSSDQVIGIKLNHSGGASLMDGDSASKGETIHCMTGLDLNSVIHPQNNEQVIIKIDTEGYEPIVVAQLKISNFWDRITHFYIEIDETRHAEKDVISFLLSEGFSEILRTSTSSEHYDILMQRC